MSRYDPLRDYLQRQQAATVRLRLDEIESLIAAPLPASARRHRPWWANETAGAHVQARAWLAAGYRIAEIDTNRGYATFVRNETL